MTDPETPEPPSWSSRAVAGGRWALLAVPVLGLAALAHSRRWLAEDAFINLRIVSNLLEGHGLVFNVGERVEAGTSPLWVLVLALLGRMRVPLEVAAVYAGCLLGAAGLLCAELAARRSSRAWLAPGGAVVFAVLPPAWDYVASGLETGLCIAWLGASYWLVAAVLGGPRGRAAWLSVAALVGLGPLVRPELAVHSAGLVSLLTVGTFIDARRRAASPARAVAGLLGAAALMPLSYQLFRMGYFALPTPNTALAKEAWSARWDQGLLYAENFFGLYWLIVPLLALVPAWVIEVRREWATGVRLRAALLVVMPLCAAVHGVFVVRMGGDFMHGRMWLPVVFAWLLPVGAIPLRRAGTGRARHHLVVAGVAATAVWAVVCGAALRVARDNEHGIGDERGWQARISGVRNPITLADHRRFPFHAQARHLQQTVSARRGRNLYVLRRLDRWDTPMMVLPLGSTAHPDVVAVAGFGAVGVAGYLLGPAVHVVDVQGLADPIAARIQLEQRRRPGHEKWLPRHYLVARFTEPRPRESGDVAAARRALGCGLAAELQQAIAAPLTWGRFLQNVSLAYDLQRLRIPRDPRQAEQQLCGVSAAAPTAQAAAPRRPRAAGPST